MRMRQESTSNAGVIKIAVFPHNFNTTANSVGSEIAQYQILGLTNGGGIAIATRDVHG